MRLFILLCWVEPRQFPARVFKIAFTMSRELFKVEI
jgi:hypothetical protein